LLCGTNRAGAGDKQPHPIFSALPREKSEGVFKPRRKHPFLAKRKDIVGFLGPQRAPRVGLSDGGLFGERRRPARCAITFDIPKIRLRIAHGQERREFDYLG
jgi:hypothetical protein